MSLFANFLASGLQDNCTPLGRGTPRQKTFYVTTPIYYVNDAPHIGHSYTTIAADVLARFFRAEGLDVRFLTGTDEHGIKIVKAAEDFFKRGLDTPQVEDYFKQHPASRQDEALFKKGITPRQLADSVVVHFQSLWKDLNISNDDFIRTSRPRHEKRVQAIIARMVASGDVYMGKYEGWYDEGQEEFVTESAARDNEYKSAINGQALVRYSEDSYFFRLTRWAPKLIEHIKANPGFIAPPARRNEVLSKLEMGVEDLCVSRLAEKLGGWGVRMPNDDRYTAWVWIDALSNYYTALGLPEIGMDDDGSGKRYWPATLHLIGKDILWFHAVYWPCFLMSLDLPLPKCIFAHGWWMSEGKKMSKSLGNFISREVIAELCQAYSVDVYRYFLLRAVPFGADGDFSREMFRQRYNAELANGVGNLLARTVNMIGRYFDGKVPAGQSPGPQEREVLAAAKDLHDSASPLMERCDFFVYLEKIMALTGATNRYIDVTAPFKLAKDPSRKERLGTILYTCAEALRIILLYLQPLMPTAAPRGLEQINWQPATARAVAVPGADPDKPLSELGAWGVLPAGTVTQKGEGLFPRKE